MSDCSTHAYDVPLKQCPLCGGKYAQVRYMGGKWQEPSAFDSGYRGECCDCGAITAAYDTEAEAVEAWNTRTPDQTIAATLGGNENRISERLRVSMPRHNGERYAKLMVGQFEQMNATLGKSRWHELFGTPERAARTLARFSPLACSYCALYSTCGDDQDKDCLLNDYDALIEWLRGDA